MVTFVVEVAVGLIWLVWAQKNDVFHLKICLKMSSFSIKMGKNKGKSLVFAKKSKKYLVGIWKVRTFAFADAEKTASGT